MQSTMNSTNVIFEKAAIFLIHDKNLKTYFCAQHPLQQISYA